MSLSAAMNAIAAAAAEFDKQIAIRMAAITDIKAEIATMTQNRDAHAAAAAALAPLVADHGALIDPYLAQPQPVEGA